MESERTSEEKTLPPSSRKLRDLRRKGYVARSPEMVTAAVLAIAFAYVIIDGQKFVDGYEAAIQEVSRQDTDQVVLATSLVIKSISIGLGAFTTTLYGLVILSSILTSVLVNGGMIFSLQHIKFNLNNLNPINGLKRIFSLRTFVEFIKRLMKLAVFVFISVVIIAQSINEPFYIPDCGLSCFQGTMKVLVGCILLVAAVLFLFVGLVDINVQRWLFLRQHRMTRSEAKRDRKEEEGSPELRSYQRRLRQGILQTSKVYSARDATIMIEGTDSIIGVRYVRGETPIPLIVCKGKGSQLFEIAGVALEKKIPKYFDEDLASGLFRSQEPGSTLIDAYFEPFIRTLKAVNLV
jgi:type III secretion protein U